jgi:hypothetical protein
MGTPKTTGAGDNFSEEPLVQIDSTIVLAFDNKRVT